MKKTILVCGGGGFIGGHLAKYFKNKDHNVIIADIKEHEFLKHEDICNKFYQGDLRNPDFVEELFQNNINEVYQLAADMGGAGYIFTGLNDANVMHNSALINLNVIQSIVKHGVEKVFYSSSACMYPEHNQLDPNNPNCEELSAYPANPDSEYGWEKLFSERMYLAFNRNYNLNVRIARFHNIFGPFGTWNNGKEKAPAALLRKAAEATDETSIEVWGDGLQTRSFLYIDECIEAIIRLMDSDFIGPVNIGSEEKVTLNQLAEMAIKVSKKNLHVQNIFGKDFELKYGFKCPQGVRGRSSDNRLYKEKIGWVVSEKLIDGLEKTYPWIHEQVKKNNL
jgi:GDP-D-mannose 3',5'-epimerase